MTDLSILEEDASSVVTPRRFPDGDYLATAVSVEFAENKNQKLYANVELKVLQPLGDQDLTGVNMDNTLYYKIFITKKSEGPAKSELAKFGIDTNAKWKELFERIIGQTVVTTIVQDDYYAKKGRDYAKVDALRSA